MRITFRIWDEPYAPEPAFLVHLAERILGKNEVLSSKLREGSIKESGIMCYNGSMPFKDRLKRNEYNKNWISNRRKEFFKNKSCVSCGSIEKLELDHINPEEKISHRIWSWTESKRIEELKKCQILCHLCHKTKTRLWWITQRKHGRSMYAYGCKCKICFLAQQKHNAQRKKRQPSSTV